MKREWQPLPLAHCFDAESLRETLDGGQAFRWRWLEAEQCWRGIFGDTACLLRLPKKPSAPLEFFPLNKTAAESEAALINYLANAAEAENFAASLPLKSDPVLAAAVNACRGLTILRQPFGEALLGFLCSSTKQIVQIRQMCDTLAEGFGEEIAPGVFALPSWKRFASVSEKDLRRCALGFRARYVAESARFIASKPGWLQRVPQLPYAEAKAELIELPGVGEKVADCVLLFGAGKLEAFPVDTWIIKIMSAHYGLEDWSPSQIAHFGRVHFGALAGLAQQYLFAQARRAGRASE